MEVNEIISQVNTIFKDVLDNDEVVISADSTANDVDEWDSLTHIQLIVAIEKHFKIRFSSGEIQGFKNVGEMCAAIKNKLG
ncbi:MAG TPA: acyl carrier protein [Bacteroidia bacterium]|nr:acyl carrier protein [Bacteroidia bacterium]